MSQSIEVVIPVHDPARPLERGLSSILGQQAELSVLGVELRVTVVCHNIPIEDLKDSVPADLAVNDSVTWLLHDDGIKSPAGPRNAALEKARPPSCASLIPMTILKPVHSLPGGSWPLPRQPPPSSHRSEPPKEASSAPREFVQASPPSSMRSRTAWPIAAFPTDCCADRRCWLLTSDTRKALRRAKTSPARSSSGSGPVPFATLTMPPPITRQTIPVRTVSQVLCCPLPKSLLGWTAC